MRASNAPSILVLFVAAAAAARATASPPNPATGSKFTWTVQNLLDRASVLGGYVDNVYTRDGAGRRLFVHERVDPGTIITVPNALILTNLKVKDEPLYQQYATQFPDLFKNLHRCTAVSIFILLENALPGMREASQWATYYATLPNYSHNFNVPHIDWEDERNEGDACHQCSPLDILLNPRVANGVTLKLLSEHRESIKEYSKENGFFRQVAHDAGSSLDVVIQLFKWSVSIVTTRAWQWEGNPGECGLVPIADLADHKDGGAVLDTHQSDSYVTFRAEETIEAGSQLMGNYDPRFKYCAESILLNWGFLPGDSGKTRPYCLTFGVMLQVKEFVHMPTAQRDIKWKLLEKMVQNVKIDGGADLGHIRLKLELRGTEKRARTVLKWLLGVMRLQHADSWALEIASKREDGFARALHMDNEHHALQEAYQLFHGVLVQFNSSDEEDRAALRHWQLVATNTTATDDDVLRARRMEMALRVRVNRRRIARMAVEFVQEQNQKEVVRMNVENENL
eukprot:g3131.t1